jgi:hypothetical protein
MAEKVEIQENFADYAGTGGGTSYNQVADAASVGLAIDQIMSDVAATEADANAFDKTVLEGGVMSTPSANLSNLGSSQVQVPADLGRSSVLPATSGGNYYNAPVSTGTYDFFKVPLTPITVGGKTMFDMSKMNLPAGIDIRDYTISSVQKKDGTYEDTMVRLPEGEASKGMSRFTSFDPVTKYATYGKPETPEAPEASVAQSLYKSPQFMAPVTASVVNGLFQMLISERMAKAQRDEQRRMLDAQFQVLEKKEEANEEKRRQFASIYASLRAERKRKG